MPTAFVEPVDYRDPDVLVSSGSMGGFATASTQATAALSRDGGRTWGETILVPLDHLAATTGVQSTLVRPDGRLLMFLFSTDNDHTHRHPIVFGSLHEGREFHFMSCVTPRQDPFGHTDGAYDDTSDAFAGHRC